MVAEGPLISVILPVYNTERYLEECLHSIQHQSYKNLEVILINDGSTDSSGEICDRYVQEDSRFQVHHVPNAGGAAVSLLRVRRELYEGVLRNEGYQRIQRDYLADFVVEETRVIT